ncbi:hypothetical protein [Sutcliffiella horikoshii]|uniref:hypothetical protein n=1 Tax=Sutcliffiella horikoshii TaxID=79883 RepID=UPI001653DE88|nr:hypothetical protein [Sutcliffiella horikoshii]
MVTCKEAGLTFDDLDQMTVGMCVDYIEEVVEFRNPKKKNVRRAKQSDFDSF